MIIGILSDNTPWHSHSLGHLPLPPPFVSCSSHLVSGRYIFLVAPGNALIMRHEHLAKRPRSISILMNSFAPGECEFPSSLSYSSACFCFWFGFGFCLVFCLLSFFLISHIFIILFFLVFFPLPVFILFSSFFFFGQHFADCSGHVDFLSGLAN